MHGLFLLYLCLTSASVYANLFDLYGISRLCNNLPEHIQQKIIDYSMGNLTYRICFGAICKSDEHIIQVAYNDYTTISILKYNRASQRPKLQTYRLCPSEHCYRLHKIKPSISCRFMPTISKSKFGSIKERFSDAQPIIALPKSFIESLVPAQKSFIKGLFLIQHTATQWYIYECVGHFKTADSVDPVNAEITRVPLNHGAHFTYGATALDSNVFIYKRMDTSAMHYRCHLPHPTDVHAAAFSPDNTHILTVCTDNTLRIWSLPTLQIKTIEQLLLIKLITTAQQFETFWSVGNLVQRLCTSLSQNLPEHTTNCAINYLTSLLSSLDQESQKILMSTYLSSVYKIPQKQPYRCTLQ